MNPFQNMEKHKGEFTLNDQKIYEAILEQPQKVISLSTSSFARDINVSQPALTRFIQVLGYQRYNDFRSDITAWSARMNASSDSSSLPYFHRFRLLINETEALFTDEYLCELCDFFLASGRIFATGMGKSFQAACFLKSILRKYDIFVNTVTLDEASETADCLRPDDLLIVFSVSANHELMNRIVNTQGKLLLVTANAGHPYQDRVTKQVLLPFLPPDPETSSVSPILFDIFVELLDSYIAQKQSVSHEEQ